MPPSRPRLTRALWRHPLAWLALASLLITFFLGAPQIEALRAFQTSEPPTATNSPPPTATLVPTTAVPTNAPAPTNTPPAAATTPPPAATPPIPATATSFVEPATPLSTETPIETPIETPLVAPAVTLPPTDTPPPPPVILATATPPPLPAPAEALTTTLIITQTEAGAPPAQNADALVELIDTFVLYSAYFLLGCGIIVFIALAVGFYYLQRRGQGSG